MNARPHIARAGRPGVRFVAALLLLLAAGAPPVACGRPPQEVPEGRRLWQGPGGYVASRGVTYYERREIAQRVPLPVCIDVHTDRYRFARVRVLPAGVAVPPSLFDTMFQLDRWRLWTPSGSPIGQSTLFVTVRGSTGIVAEYERLPAGTACEP